MARNGFTASVLPVASRAAGHRFAVSIPTGRPGGVVKLADYPAPRGVKSEWQHDALAYVETIEPVGYVVHLTANIVAACDLRLGWVDDDGTVFTAGDEIDSKEAEAPRRALNALKGPRGGIGELKRRAGLLLTAIGEFYLLGSPVDPAKPDAGVWWEALSTEEIKPPEKPARDATRNRTGAETETLDPNGHYLARVWRSDARHSSRADCALRRCLDTCREMAMLAQMMEAVITSRLPMGILLIPASMRHRSPLQRMDDTSPLTDDDVGETEPEFIDALAEHMSAPLTNLRSAAALVPMVLEGEVEDLKAVRMVDIAKDLDTYASALRAEMIRRLAIGLDIPPEVLEGKGGLNHWSAFSVDSEFLFKHIVPVGQLMADGFTAAYLQPILLEAEKMSEEEAARWVLVFDPSPIAAQADESETAMRLWEAGVISDQTLLEKQGWDPAAVQPDDEERCRRLIEKLLFSKTPNLRLTDEALKKVGLDPKWIEWVAGAQDVVASPADSPPLDPAAEPAVNGQGNGLVKGNGKVNPNEPGAAGGPGDPVGVDKTGGDGGKPEPEGPQALHSRDMLVAQLRVRVDAALDRAFEVAGGRINNAVRKHPDVAARFDNRPRRKLVSMITAEEMVTVGLTNDKLLAEAWQDLDRDARGWIAAWLEAAGVRPVEAVVAAADAAQAIIDQVHAWAIAGILRPPVPGVDGLRCPVELIRPHIPAPGPRPRVFR